VSYTQGDLVTVRCQFYKEDGSVAAPLSVQVRVQDPAGNVTTPSVTPIVNNNMFKNFQPGEVYTAQVDTTALGGTYNYLFSSGPPYQGAEKSSFVVDPSGF
jgi:hypothetical protein